MFFRGVNRVIDGGTAAMVARPRAARSACASLVALVFVALLGATYWVYNRVPTGFVPDEDQGYIFILIQAPQGASLDYTMGIEKQVEQVLGEDAGDPAHLRRRRLQLRGLGAEPGHPVLHAEGLPRAAGRASTRPRRSSAQLFGMFSEITGAKVIPFLPPSINGLGSSAASSTSCSIRPAAPIENLANAAQQLVGARRNRTPGLAGVFTQFTADDPQLVVTIDREQAKSLGISLGDITSTMQILLGSAYVNDFDFNNRSYRVYVQADSQFRSNPERHRALLTCATAPAR